MKQQQTSAPLYYFIVEFLLRMLNVH